jgi:hypothetical protein
MDSVLQSRAQELGPEKVSGTNGTRLSVILFTKPVSGGGAWFLQ